LLFIASNKKNPHANEDACEEVHNVISGPYFGGTAARRQLSPGTIAAVSIQSEMHAGTGIQMLQQ
jgi:hypothetical protein